MIEKMYTRKEVAELLNVSYATIVNWVSEGKLKAIKIGNTHNSPVRVPESSLQKLIKEASNARQVHD